jgi:porin
LAGVSIATALAVSSPARAADAASPAWELEVRNTAEVWRNLQGGLSVGNATLDKLQASALFKGDAVGWRGFSAYAEAFKTNSESLSGARTGDTQTASNIEAPHVTRLFELWAAQAFGEADKPGWVQVSAGVLDLNRTFDSIATADLFVSSSHGIAPDLSHSGFGAPSIFPLTAPGAQVDWRPADRLLLHLGAFADPDPSQGARFLDLRLSGRTGAIVMAQADYRLGKDAQASVAVWRHTADLPSFADPTRRLAPRPGAYAFVEGPTPLPGGPRGWLRAGFADGRVQDVSGYLGAGLVWKGLVPGRGGDRFGLAVAHARIGAGGRSTGLPDAETSYEATYSFRLGRFLHLQPDVQHIVHPALAPGLRNATAVGLRLVASAKVGEPGDGE